MKDREFVESTRDPAQFNSQTFMREYGHIPK